MTIVFVAMLLGGQGFPPIQPVDVAPAIRAYQEGQRLRSEQQNAESYATQTEAYATSAKAEQNAAEIERAQNVLVGRLIAEGNCADARRVALGEGRFDLVDRVSVLCRITPP